MTLREMIAAHPDAFYPQTWYEGEAFLDRERHEGVITPRALRERKWWMRTFPYSAADMASLWLENPHLNLWDFYLWTSDTDDSGQRVYVGQNGKGLEIHRHIHLTKRFWVPV